MLETLAERGFTVQARAGHFPVGGAAKNPCTNGDTNSLAAFLVGAGNYSYYHCSATWATADRWPAVPDQWLDWLPEYDCKTPQPPHPSRPRAAMSAGC